MSKRFRDDRESDRPPKRSKPDVFQTAPVIEDIQFARQLQQLLSFRQDGVQQLRNGIASFKAFLESILYHKDEDDRGRQLSILREYLEGQKPSDIKDTDHPFLDHLWQAWSFGNQNAVDALSSSVSAVLALLLKTLSGLIDFRDYGYLLCRTALQHQHLRLIKRHLDAPKHKDFLISPCLRLLTEISAFDGGVLAKEVYKRREQTFDSATTRRNLGLIKLDLSEEDARRRPSIRSVTIRYVLSLLKYLHEGGKIDLLKGRAICIALFHHLRDDPTDIATELLNITEQCVLKDDALPRTAKSALLVQNNLERVTELATRSSEDHGAAVTAFNWLKAVCEKSTYGVLQQRGWYPPATEDWNQRYGNEAIHFGLDSIDFYDRDERATEVKNTTILAWLRTLRPHSNLLERELVLICFKAAPELVAAYFAEHNMQLDPKLTNTWIGYASFLFEILQLSVPSHLGNEDGWAELPPQTSILLANVLPQPLTQKVLIRCLNQNNDLVRFFSIRMLVLAFEKLASILIDLRRGAADQSDTSSLWQQAAERLLDRFAGHCPEMKDVVACFRRIPNHKDHALQRESLTKLLRMYYEVTPLLALEEQFDVSNPLTAALLEIEDAQQGKDPSTFKAVELNHLLKVALLSPAVRWFSRQGGLQLSPITTSLKLYTRNLHTGSVRELILHVLSDQQILNACTTLDALVASLLDADSDGPKAVWDFLDDCLSRVSRRPVKYLDDLESLQSRTASKDHSPNAELLIAGILEQAPFLEANQSRSTVIAWISRLVRLLDIVSDDSLAILEPVQDELRKLDGYKDCKMHEKDLKALIERAQLGPVEQAVPRQTELERTDRENVIPFAAPPEEPTDHPELLRWSRKDINLALNDGDVSALTLCLCSQQPAIRIQAHQQLRKVEDILFDSSLEDKEPIYVLIGEIIETYERHCMSRTRPLPYLAGVFATRALTVQLQPAHFIYPKLNRFLNLGPDWRFKKMIEYWVASTILGQPEEDDAYWKEAQWVLDWLVDGLRTPADLEILRRTNAFEKTMSLHASPGAAAAHRGVRDRVLELIYRASCIEGGSTTLVTRSGVLSWLQLIGSPGVKGVKIAIRKKLLETCDRDRIEAWSGLKLEAM